MEQPSRHNTSTIQVEFFELHRTSVVQPHTSKEDQTTGEERGDNKEKGASDTELLLKTSFSMEAGETVVVATSRLDGVDEALIVLLTATR